MGLKRLFIFAGLSGLALAVAAASVQAQEDVCANLEAQLASLQQQSTGEDNYASWDAAVSKQRSQLDRSTGEARAAGCMGGFLIFQRKRDPRCDRLLATINRMRANLTQLSAKRDRASGFGMNRERNDLLRELAMNDCGPQYAAYRNRGGGLFDTLFRPRGGMWEDQGGDFLGDGHFGTYRTLCVRTCDGYYFPISFSTVQSKFGQDEQICRSMCPGTDVALFIHRSPGEDSEAMVSLAGEPYSSLPNAFKYRREYDKACTCHSEGAIAGLEPQGDATMISPVDPSLPRLPVPIPEARPPAGEDPETMANLEGSFVPAPVVPRADETPVAGLGPDGKAVRVVGPEFYVAQ